MSDQPEVKRLVDEGGSRLGELLRSSELDQPTEQQLRALDAAIAPLLNGPPGGGGGSGGAAPRIAGPASAGAGGVVKVALAVAVAVGGGALYLARGQQQPPEPPAQVAQQVEPKAVPEVGARVEPPAPEAVVEAPAPQHAVVAPRVNRPPPAAAPVAAVEPEDELVSLQRGVDAMRAGHAAEALAAAQQHLRQHPDSAMAQERELVAIEALVSLQRLPEARERASAFRKAWPTSTHQTRLDELVGPE